MEFEWDPHKAASNLEKHRISFVAATAVFEDPERIEAEASSGSDDQRLKSIGQLADGTVVTVISTLREDRIRIISVRKARRNERNAYHQDQETP